MLSVQSLISTEQLFTKLPSLYLYVMLPYLMSMFESSQQVMHSIITHYTLGQITWELDANFILTNIYFDLNKPS